MRQERSRQQESFPKFDLVAAKAAIERMDAAVCVFELRRRMIGQAFITDVGDSEIILNSTIIEHDQSVQERQDCIKTIDTPVALDRYRRLFICPECRAKKVSLYFKNGWSCADCLRLIYRSQLVDKDVKLWEERDALSARLRWGRPKGMHNRTYMKERQRLFALDNQLSGRSRKYASEAQDMIIHSRWVPGSEIELWSTRYCVRGSEFVVHEALR